MRSGSRFGAIPRCRRAMWALVRPACPHSLAMKTRSVRAEPRTTPRGRARARGGRFCRSGLRSGGACVACAVFVAAATSLVVAGSSCSGPGKDSGRGVRDGAGEDPNVLRERARRVAERLRDETLEHVMPGSLAGSRVTIGADGSSTQQADVFIGQLLQQLRNTHHGYELGHQSKIDVLNVHSGHIRRFPRGPFSGGLWALAAAAWGELRLGEDLTISVGGVKELARSRRALLAGWRYRPLSRAEGCDGAVRHSRHGPRPCTLSTRR